jgi:NO-binding membrane sensor protein with MHYT domain
MNDIIIAKVGAWIYSLCPAILGAIISMLSVKQEEPKIMVGLTLFLGIGVAHYLGNATIEYFDIHRDSYMASSIILIYGLFGLATIREIFKQIPDVLKATRKRFIGE